MSYLWGNSLAINSDYREVVYSEDGTYIVALTYGYSLDIPAISIFKAIDGTLFD